MVTRILICLLICNVSLAVEEEKVTFRGVEFRIMRSVPEKVRIGWRGEDQEILHSLRAAKVHFERKGEKVAMLMNGGIFEPGCVPSGLYVENGKVLRPLNRRPGKGNFFLKPNGVFLVAGSPAKARVLETEVVAALKDKKSISLAVQSGPLLLQEGKVHPAFNEGSKSKLIRNGVGVDAEGQVVFAITDKGQLCNLWTFAKLFESLKCREALFLDGDLSRMVVNPPANVTGQGFASILAIMK